MLPGIEEIKASLPLRDGTLKLEIKREQDKGSLGFRSNGTIIESSGEEAIFSYSEKELWVEALI